MKEVFAVWKNKSLTDSGPTLGRVRNMVLDSVFEDWFAAQMYVDGQPDIWNTEWNWTDILPDQEYIIPGKGRLICGNTNGWQIWKMALYESPEEKYEEINERKKNEALKKLTKEEIELLNLKGEHEEINERKKRRP